MSQMVIPVTSMFRIAAISVWGAVAIFLSPAPASAEKRVALVIGNGAYQKVSTLANSTNDAIAIAEMLKAAGFSVALHQNLAIRELRKAIGDFSDMTRDADTAVVYYSGHGIEVNGINYLVPVDAVLHGDIDVPYETFSLDNLAQTLEPARRLRLIMLDACRDNPFLRSMKRAIGTRAVSRGLAPVEPTSVNTLVGYAAKAGSVALDGDGRNSPYATALLKHLATPGLDVRIAFGHVRDEVLKITKNKHEPFVYGSLGGGIVSIVDAVAISTAGTTPQTQGPVPSVDPAAQAWAIAQNTTSVAVLEEYIRQFGSSSYGGMARARLAELKKSKVAVVTPQSSEKTVAASATPMNGMWLVRQNCDRGKFEIELNLKHSSASEFSGSSVGITTGQRSQITNGRIEGDKVTFTRASGAFSDQWTARLKGPGRLSGASSGPAWNCTYAAVRK